MSEIPDDVMKRARAVSSEWFPYGHHDEALLCEQIARALMAAERAGAERERERCAKVAEEPVARPFGEPPVYRSHRQIADAIRAGEGVGAPKPQLPKPLMDFIEALADVMICQMDYPTGPQWLAVQLEATVEQAEAARAFVAAIRAS